MKGRLIIINFLLIIGCLNYIQAQSPFSLRVEGGLSYSDLRNWDYGSYKLGYNLGIKAEYQLPQNFFFLSGISLTTKGTKYHKGTITELPDYGYGSGYGDTDDDIRIDVYDVKMNPIYLQVPLYFGHRFDLNIPASLIFSGGLYLSYGIGGKTKGYEDSIYRKETFEFNYFKYNNRFDWGMGVMAGMEYRRFGLYFGFDYGLEKVHKSEDTENQSFYISLGYKIF